ncbi:hypothetical protein M885DRAFT_621635 [Pelagophyceae sp. CCMP2097]|nr:hypothetical protein M885DRAFT_621635 [Pelagophyceae sp. CCMP2097]
MVSRTAVLLCSLQLAFAFQCQRQRSAAVHLATETWLEDSLGEASSASHHRRPLTTPLGGVSVSDEGFVILLSKDGMALPVSIHPSDVDKVQSPEALTLLQLMQGIDVCTFVFPRSALEDLFEEDAKLEKIFVRRRPLPNAPEAVAVSPKREAAVAEAAPKLAAALSSKLGLNVGEKNAATLLQEFADDNAQLNPKAFSSLTQRAREMTSRTLRAHGCALDVHAADGSVAEDVPPFIALALAFRHGASLDLSADLFSGPRSLAVDDSFFDEKFPALMRAEDIAIDAMTISAHYKSMCENAKKHFQKPE